MRQKLRVYSRKTGYHGSNYYKTVKGTRPFPERKFIQPVNDISQSEQLVTTATLKAEVEATSCVSIRVALFAHNPHVATVDAFTVHIAIEPVAQSIISVFHGRHEHVPSPRTQESFQGLHSVSNEHSSKRL